MRQRGAAIVEAVIALPILLAFILGAIQFGLIYQAKATLNFAGLQAARAGAVDHARPEAIRMGLARGLAPLYSPDSSMEGVARTIARVNARLVTDARIRILNPTREAFEDFGEEVEGIREIPNDRLHSRSTRIGALSGMNIQDANLLRIQVMYGYELQVPLVSWFIARILLSTGERWAAFDAFQQQLLRRGRLPIATTATVRMQSPARMSDAVVSRGELPDVPRIPADSRPSDDDGDAGDTDEEPQGGSSSGEAGSNLSDGFLGFGSGSGDGSGGGASPGGGSGGSGGGGGDSSGGGGNSGNPAQCPADGGSPSPPGPTASPFSGASLSGVTLPSLSVGDSIHVVTGNKYYQEADLPAGPETFGVTFGRHYNSDSAARSGVMGAGWRHAYETWIESNTDAIDLWQADGRRLRFLRSNGSGSYLSERGGEGELRVAAGGYRWLWPNGRQLTFDPLGKLTAMRQGPDHVALKYNDARQLEQVTDSNGRQLRIEYYSNGRIARVRLGGEIAWRYAYDTAGNLAQVVSPDGRSRRYEYTDMRHPNHLTAVTAGTVKPPEYGGRNRFVAIARWEYDDRGRAIAAIHPGGAEKVALAYGENTTDVTDPFGRVTHYDLIHRDGVALVAEVRGPGCAPCGTADVRYEFNRRHQVTSLRPKKGPALRFHYDDTHRLVRVEQNMGDGYRKHALFEYEADSLRPSRILLPSINPDGAHGIAYAYRKDGQVESIRETGYSPAQTSKFRSIERTVRFAYDADGRVTSIDGARTDVADVTRIGYDNRGRRTLITTPEGNEYRVGAFSVTGRAQRVHRTGWPDVHIEYDPSGRLSAMTELRSTGKRMSRYAYDVLGQLTGVTDEHGRTRTISYDAAGRPDGISVDDTDESIRLRYAADGQIETAALFSRGVPIRIHRFVYDEQRRLAEVRDGEGPPLRRIEYDGNEPRPMRLIDPLGQITRLTYDTAGSPDSVVAPDGGVTRFARDTQQRLVEVRDPNDARSRYLYDDFGRRVLEETADGGALWTTYDEADNPVERQRAGAERTRYVYDADDRMIAIEGRDGATRLTYRGPHLVAIDGYRGAERFGRDRDGQRVEHARMVAGRWFRSSRRFDGPGRVVERILPSGQRLKYSYDHRGALHAIVLDRLLGDAPVLSRSSSGIDVGPRNSRTVHPMGRFVYGNGIELRNFHDARTGKLASRIAGGVARAQYSYDEAGQIVAIASDAGEQRYEYDASGRLVSANLPSGHFKYSYDTNGNRLTATALRRGTDRTASRAWKPQFRPVGTREAAADNSLESELTYAAGSNRLAKVDDEHASSVYGYDAAGNPTEIGSRAFQYNSDGRPWKLFVGGRLIATYAYNLSGERISKTLHSGPRARTTFYIYESSRLVAETDSRGRVAREYIYLGQHPVALLESGEIFWIHTDHLGAPIAMTDADRRVVWRAEYEPFGKARVDEDPDGDGVLMLLNLRFPGQYADAESGTHYNIMRDYDPATGRYLTADPLGLYDGTNPYAYVQGSPIDRTDPLGLYLFAFDGTWVNRTSGTLTNVELFRRYYDPSPDERNSFYRRGIGTPADADTDWRDSVDRLLGGATGLGGREILDDALNFLDRLIRGGVRNVRFDGVIDIVGFSRGAAIGRAFANEIYSRMDDGYYRHALARDGSCRSLRIRFMGLFDTVAAFGIPTNDINIGYDLTIDDRVGTVAHAIALNEHRAAFDLISIQYSERAANTSQYRQERAFIGAHSDIGGGYANGDLSDVALRWMHTQASVAGVRMTPLLEEHLTVSAPLLHDERAYLAQDREIFYPNDPLWERETCPLPVLACAGWEPPATQRQATAPQFRFPELRDMIRDTRQSDAVRGIVDMERYRAWLRSRGQL